MRLGAARKYTGVWPSVAVWEELAPATGEGGWVGGGAGGARLSRGAPGTLTVYTAPRPDVPYPG